MESRIYATILFLVFGIIQAHSHPKGRNALHEFSEFGMLQSSISEPRFGYSIGANFYGDLGDSPVDRRIKREIKLEESAILERLYKQDRVAAIARAMANAEAARRAYPAVLREFYRLLDGYIATGFNVQQAVEQLERQHPHVADQVVGNQQRLA